MELSPELKRLHQTNTAVSDIGYALADLGTVLTQGIRDENKGKLGDLAVVLRKAAWRLEFGHLDGWSDHELVRRDPPKPIDAPEVIEVAIKKSLVMVLENDAQAEQILRLAAPIFVRALERAVEVKRP